MMKVGFRVYDETGDKADEMGTFEGFSSTLDAHIGAYTVRLQPPGTMV
jgi:hypothetical protein